VPLFGSWGCDLKNISGGPFHQAFSGFPINI
jgi:hypothetical protein